AISSTSLDCCWIRQQPCGGCRAIDALLRTLPPRGRALDAGDPRTPQGGRHAGGCLAPCVPGAAGGAGAIIRACLTVGGRRMSTAVEDVRKAITEIASSGGAERDIVYSRLLGFIDALVLAVQAEMPCIA